MTWLEMASIAAGLGIGYWIVSIATHKPAPGEDPFDQPVPGPAESEPAPESSAPAPWHEVLEVSEWATAEEVTAAWRAKMGQYHPDKVATLGPEIRALAERKTRELNQAYEDAMRGR